MLLSAADENKLVNTVKTKQNRSNTDELKGGNDEVPLHMFLNWSRSFLPEQLRCFRRNRARQTQISRAELVLNASLSIHFPYYDPRESSESRVESAKCSTRGRQLQNKNTRLCDNSTCRLCVDPLEQEQSWQRPGAGALLPASSLPSNPVLWLWGRQLTPLLQNKSPGLAERVFLWFSSQFDSLFCGLSLSVSPLNDSQLLFTSY